MIEDGLKDGDELAADQRRRSSNHRQQTVTKGCTFAIRYRFMKDILFLWWPSASDSVLEIDRRCILS